MELSADRRDYLDFILQGPEDDDWKEWEAVYDSDFVAPLESALELHYVAREWNWDDGKTAEVMNSIISHPLCDRGTALLLYWRGAAPYLEKDLALVEEWQKPKVELARRVEHHLRMGDFRSAQISYDPVEDGNSPDHAPDGVPAEFLSRSPGEQPSEF